MRRCLCTQYFKTIDATAVRDVAVNQHVLLACPMRAAFVLDADHTLFGIQEVPIVAVGCHLILLPIARYQGVKCHPWQARLFPLLLLPAWYLTHSTDPSSSRKPHNTRSRVRSWS